MTISILELTLLPPIARLLSPGRRSGDALPAAAGGGTAATAAADDATALRALHTAPRADVLIEDESPDDPGPAAVAGEGFVEIGGDAVEGVEFRPGDGGKVVVFVVEADVVGEDVERAVVGVGFWRGEGV